MRHKTDIFLEIKNRKYGANEPVQISFLSREAPDNHGKVLVCMCIPRKFGRTERNPLMGKWNTNVPHPTAHLHS